MMFCRCQHLVVQYYIHLELCFYYLCFFFWKIVSSESLYLGWHWRNPICCLTIEWRRYHNAVSTSTKKCCKKYCKFTQRFQLRRGNSILPLSIRPLTTVCWARVQVLVPGLRLRAKRPFAPSREKIIESAVNNNVILQHDSQCSWCWLLSLCFYCRDVQQYNNDRRDPVGLE